MKQYLIHLTRFFTILASLGVQIYALSPNYSACQLDKGTTTSPLEGCPAGTLFVSPTDNSANYKTVQAAVESLWVASSWCLSPVMMFVQASDGRRNNSDWKRRILWNGQCYAIRPAHSAGIHHFEVPLKFNLWDFFLFRASLIQILLLRQGGMLLSVILLLFGIIYMSSPGWLTRRPRLSLLVFLESSVTLTSKHIISILKIVR